MTVDQGLQKIHREYEGDVDYLEFDDEETELRVEYLKDGIKDWQDKFPEKREQFYSLADADDGDTTTDGGTIYDCPENFIRPSGRVKIGDSIYLTYVDPSEMEKHLEESPTKEWYTVLGYPGAFQIKINPAQSSGSAINYDYYGEVTLPATTTDLIPISRPLYAVYYALWKIFKEDDPVQEEKYKKLMDEEERKEAVALAKTPGTPNRIRIGGAGFGRTYAGPSDINSDH